MTPYLVGRRSATKPAAPHGDQQDYLRAGDGVGQESRYSVGWSAATFGAGAVLGWMLSSRAAKRGSK